MISRLLEAGVLPDSLIRFGIRTLLRTRIREEQERAGEDPTLALKEFADALRDQPIAINTSDANEQHYEVPARFYELCLGSHLKYSSGLWEEGTERLNDAEAAMLKLTSERADLQDGQDVLELGCGWGSLTLWMGEHYPKSRITAVSNSSSQRKFILDRGLDNINVITCDMNQFDIDDRFDRVVSVEMFEHMKNHALLLKKISGWLREDGRLFIHIFTHRDYAYHFEVKDETDWMARYFFTGGMMPADRLFYEFQDDLELEEHWKVRGNHYGRTARAWLENMDANESEIRALFRETYGSAQEEKFWNYWRVFYMACEELWNYKEGEEWLVSHYRMKRK